MVNKSCFFSARGLGYDGTVAKHIENGYEVFYVAFSAVDKSVAKEFLSVRHTIVSFIFAKIVCRR